MLPKHSSQSEEGETRKPSKRKMPCKDTEEYRKRRDRNNVAVKLSRERTRAKARETTDKVRLLKEENRQLEQKVTLLSKELSLLKDLFLAHAGGISDPVIKVEAGRDSGALRSQSPGIPVNGQAVEKDHQYFSPGITSGSK